MASRAASLDLRDLQRAIDVGDGSNALVEPGQREHARNSALRNDDRASAELLILPIEQQKLGHEDGIDPTRRAQIDDDARAAFGTRREGMLKFRIARYVEAVRKDERDD